MIVDSIDNASNDSMDISTDSSDEMFRGSPVSMSTRFICMGILVVSLILLLLPYTFMDKVKRTMLAKLMRSYCILGLLAVTAYILHTLFEFVIPATNAVCSIVVYLAYYLCLGGVISKVLFVFHIGYIFYNSYKMVLKDTTANQIFRLKIGYVLTIAVVPLIMILIIIIHNHVINEIKFIAGERCLYSGDRDTFTVTVLIIFVVCAQLFGVLIIISLVFLLHNAYKTQKAVGHDVKNLFRIALVIVVAFGIAWTVCVFGPLYAAFTPLVIYLTIAIENLLIILVFCYNNNILTNMKTYCMKFRCCNSAQFVITIANNNVV